MRVRISDDSLEKTESDAVVFTLFENSVKNFQLSEYFASIPQFKLEGFSGKLYESFQIPATDNTPFVLLLGAGKKEDFDSRVQRNLAGVAVRRLLKAKIKTLAFHAYSYDNPSLIIEGVGLGEFDPGLYKASKEKETKIEELIILGKMGLKDIKESLDVVETINWVRQLIAEPANRLTPTHIVSEVKKMVRRNPHLDLEVINEKDAEKTGMGAFVGIAKGSHEPSFMVVIKYSAGKKFPTLGVVGKGVTFDSGGISLKPGEKMHEMKMDMAGAAATIGLMRLVGELRPKLNVVGVAPLTENLPGGGALKPGDVVYSLSGKTIEVLNTDAEGRVVLSDGLTYVQKLGATKIVDLATLTGAVVVALGGEASAVLGNDQEFVDQIIKSGKQAGERIWQLPLYQEHKELLKSDIADLANIPPSRGAGVIAGAAFLQEFIQEKNVWAHLDIAGTAWLEGEKPYLAKGPTGVGVRTLLNLVKYLSQ